MKTLMEHTGLRALAVLTLMLAMTVAAFPQKRSKANATAIGRVATKAEPMDERGSSPTPLAPTPIFVQNGGTVPPEGPRGGTVDCKDLINYPDTRLSHITQAWEFKIDPPNAGTYRLDGANAGGAPLGGLETNNPNNASMFMRILKPTAGEMTRWELLASPLSARNVIVSAVIIKGGSSGGANVYPYPSGAVVDTGGFVTPSGQDISHISFCFEQTTAPSAAPVSVTGRVTTSAGRSISRAAVTIVNVNSGEMRTVYTNSFGYYRFDQLTASELYVLTASARGYTFGRNNFSLTLNESVEGVNFVAN